MLAFGNNVCVLERMRFTGLDKLGLLNLASKGRTFVDRGFVDRSKSLSAIQLLSSKRATMAAKDFLIKCPSKKSEMFR